MKCPQFGCEAKPTVEEIRSIVSPDVFDKYLDFHQDLMVTLNKDNYFYCSKVGCNNVIKKKDEKG